MENATVGITAYNEERGIRKSVESALAQKEVSEVIVVASGCTDRTVEIVKEMMKEDKRVKLIEEKERRGKPAAVNKILKSAKGKYVMLTDADVIMEKGAAGKLLDGFDSEKVGIVAGNPQYFAPEGMFSWWGKFASECYSEERMKKAKRKEFFDPSGYLYAVRKEVAVPIPEKVTSEEIFVSKAIWEKGYEERYVPEAIVRVGYPQNIRDYVMQKTRTHYGHLQVIDREVKKEESNGSKIIRVFRKVMRLRSAFPRYFRVAEKMIRSPKDYCYFLLYVLTESVVWSTAYLKYYSGLKEEWKQVRSTK